MPRLLWDRFLDPFEDGYQNWWIAGNFAETGQYRDLYSGMTRGNWLPGYHMFVAGIITGFGMHIMPVLKAANVAFALATTGLVYLLARPRGKATAALAATLFALNPVDVVVSSFAIPEAATLLSLFLGVYLVESRRLGSRQSLLLASPAFLVASTLRYEVWGFLALYLIWSWARKSLKTREAVVLAGPAFIFAALWWMWTSQYGFLPAIIIGQTSADVRFKSSIGALAPVGERLIGFFAWYLSWTPFALVAILWGVVKERRATFLPILVFFYAAEITYTALGFGNPSPRYIHLTIPIVSVYSASAIVAVGSWLRRRWTSIGEIRSLFPTAAALTLSVLLVGLVVNPTPTPGTMLQGTLRAGEFLQTVPLPEGKLLLSESPIAAYYSGYSPSRIVGSTFLPENSTAAAEYIGLNVGFVVMVTVPYYRLRTLFPDQANGANGNHLRLLYDATGPEYDLGAPRVLVFEVIP